MSEAEIYTAKENAKSQLLSALISYLEAASNYGMSNSEQASEIDDLFNEVGKSCTVTDR